MTDHCFTYGSLMCEDIMSRVCDASVRGEAASLLDHARHPVRDEDYPGMVAMAGHAVSGVLYRDLPAKAWVRLDEFEGGMYQRCSVSVKLGNGDQVEAWAYLFRPAYRHLLLPGEWDFQRFLAEGKLRFELNYMGFGILASTRAE